MLSKLRVPVVFFVIFLIFPFNVDAAVLINEISPSTDPEWIELFNDDEVDEDLTGFLLEDGNSSHSDDLNLTGVISAKGYLVLVHDKGWLNDGGDTLKLYNAASPSAIIDQYTFGNIDSSKSIARSPNGSENWTVVSITSKGSVNPNPTYEPTSIPTQTPTSTPGKTLTPTPNPTKTPTPIPTKTPTPTPSPTGSPDDPVATDSGDVLGAEVEPEIPSPSPEPDFTFALENKNKIIAIVFISLGILLIGGSLYFALKTSKSNRLQNDI